MFRKLLLVLLVVVGLAVVAFAVLLVITPAAPIPEQPPSKPAVERRKAALQADAEGQYVPGYHFVVGPLRFTGFSLRPEAEPGEAKRAYHKVIARDVLPFGVRLKRCLAPLDGRFGGRLLRNGSRGRDHQEYGEGDNRETDDDEQDE